MNKKAISIIVGLIIGALVLVIVITSIIKPTKVAVEQKFKVIESEGEFIPFVTQLSPEEITVQASLNALVIALNAMGKNEEVTNLRGELEKIDWYKITYWLDYEDDYADTSFDTHYIKLSSKELKEPAIHYTRVNEGTIGKQVRKRGDRKVFDIEKVINMQLELQYNTGKNIKISTKQKGADVYSGRDLKTWNAEEDEGCEDSPTFIQGEGIKVFFCGYKNNDNKKNEALIKTKIIECPECVEEKAQVNRDGFFETIFNVAVTGFRYYLNIDPSKEVVVSCEDGEILAIGDQLQDAICVSCEQTGEKCSIEGFELPHEVKQGDESDTWIKGLGDPKYIVYYEAFPTGEDAAWQVSAISVFTDIVMWGGLINLIPLAGTGLSKLKYVKAVIKPLQTGGAIIKDATVSAVKGAKNKLLPSLGKEIREEVVSTLSERLTKEGAEALAEEATKEAIEVVGKEMAKNTVRDVTKNLGEKGVRITGKQQDEIGVLLQKEYKDMFGNPEFFDKAGKLTKEGLEKLSKNSEETVGAYLRQFPGKRNPLKPDQIDVAVKQFGSSITKIASILSIKGGKELAEKTTQEAINVVGRELTQNALDKSIEKVSKESLGKISENQIDDIGKIIGDNYRDMFLRGPEYIDDAGRLTSKGLEEVSSKAKNRVKLYLRGNVQDLTEEEAELIAKQFADTMQKDLRGVKLFSQATVLLKIAQDRANFQSFIRQQFIEESAEAGGKKVYKLSQEALEEAFESKLPTLLDSVPLKHQAKLYQKALKRSRTIIGRDGKIKWHKIIGVKEGDAAAAKIAKEFDDAFLKDPRFSETIWKIIKSIPGSIKDRTIGGPVLPVALSSFTIISHNPFKQVQQVTEWVAGKRYTLGLGIAILSVYSDSMNEKRTPAGVNNLALSRPALIEEKKIFRLDKAVLPYYVQLDREDRDDELTSRFFLASPCKTDIDLRKKKCTCAIDQLLQEEDGKKVSSGYLYDFGNNNEFMIAKNVVGGKQITKAITFDGKTDFFPAVIGGDPTYAIKECPERGFWDENVGFWNNIDREVSCISLSTDQEKYEDYNNGFNYCYSGSHTTYEAAKYAALVAEITIDVVAVGACTVVSGGACLVAAPLISATNGMLFAILQSYVLDDLIKWPNQ